MKPQPGEVLFFDSAADLRAWLADHHQSDRYAWIAFYKKNSGRSGPTYAEAVDEALCFGWIDGQLSGVDEHSYAVRFTPRRPSSLWSSSNVRRIAELRAAGRLVAAGAAAYDARREDRTGLYAADLDSADLSPELEADFRVNGGAWDFWRRQPPGYRRQMTWWVVSAKREETRRRRLAALIEVSAAERRVDPLNLPKVGARGDSG